MHNLITFIKQGNKSLSQMTWFSAVILLFILVYFRVPFIFFQQDEWFAFGNIIALGPKLVFHRFEVGDVNHFVPLNSFLSFLLFKIFKLNYLGYNIVSLFLHSINGVLLYYLGFKLLRHRVFALVCAILFVASASAAELVMWPLVGINTLTLTFALLAWLAVLRYRESRRIFGAGLLVASLIILALLTNEYAAGMLIFIPALTFALSKKSQVRRALQFLLPFIVLGFGYLLFRLSIQEAGGVLVEEVNLEDIFSKIIQFPVRYLGQLLLTSQAVLLPGQLLANDLVISDFVLREVFFWFGLLALALILALITSAAFRKVAPPGHTKNLGLVLVFILASSLPFAFIPGEAGKFLIFAPRYLYFGIAGVSLLIAQVVQASFLTKKRLLKIIISLYVAAFFILGVFGNSNRAQNLHLEGRLREGILEKMKKIHPSLSRKAIFYTESDKAFYGLPPQERIMPFQSGFGQTLLVWYQGSENFPKGFFRDRFLWEITDQGYKEDGERGFGYFRDFELLAETLKEEDLAPTSAVAFRYDSVDRSVEDMSSEVRGRLAGYFAPKRQVNPEAILLSASENSKEAQLATDGKRETAWRSELPYAGLQHFTIDLQKTRRIAQITIDSYNNKDQNEVGYSVLLSEDAQNWKEVFYSKRYPPGKDGLVKIYIKPQDARYLRIGQKGFHQFAPWVIYELALYESADE